MTKKGTFVRRGSIVLLIAWVGLLVGTLAQRRMRHAQVVPSLVGETPSPDGDRPIQVQRGARFTKMTGLEPSFRVAAAQVVRYVSGWDEYTDVELSLYHAGEVAYGLAADIARYSDAHQEATISGHAQLSLRGGVTVRADAFEIHDKRRVLESQGPAIFAGPAWAGLAGGLRCDLGADTIDLVDGVSVSSRLRAGMGDPPLVLLAPALSYQRARSALTFPAGSHLLQGGLELSAAGGDVQLLHSNGELRRARLAGPLHGGGTLDDGSLVAVKGGDTFVDRTESGGISIHVEPEASTGWVRLVWDQPGVGRRELLTWRLLGEGRGSRLDWLEGQGIACAVELIPGQEPRRLQGDRLRLELDGGTVHNVQALGQVRIEEGPSWATGGELRASFENRVATLLPTAGQRVALGSGEVTARCDRATSDGNGTLIAEGQVSGELRPGAAAKKAETTRFAADSVNLPAGGRTLVMEGNARVWQGERVLRAARLTFDRRDDVVSGTGEVVSSAPVAASATHPKTGAISIKARQLRYDRPAGQAVFEGDVELQDPGARATCQRLVATLDSLGAIKIAELDGGVVVTDSVTGRELHGQHGRAVADAAEFEMWGGPVLLKEAGGDQVKAERLIWRRADNTVLVRGGPDTPTETIYHAPRGTPVRERRKTPSKP